MVEFAESAAALREGAAENPGPDLIVLDIMLPRLSGSELCARLRTDGDWTPILMLTTESSEEMKAQGKAAGATGWMVKPFDPQTLLAVIGKVLA